MGKLRLTAPIYLLTSTEPCYRCGKDAPVVALACKTFNDSEKEQTEDAGHEDEPILVDNITEIPASVLKLIREIHPQYEKRRSRMADCDYFMNICPHCDAHFGDFFLFSEPEGAFFPIDDDAAAAITIRTLAISGSIEIDGSYGIGLGSIIFEKGRVLQPP